MRKSRKLIENKYLISLKDKREKEWLSEKK